MADKSSALKSTGKFIMTVIGLGIIGAIFGVIGAYIGFVVLGDEKFVSLGLGLLGLMIGYPLGVIIGIVLFKKALRQRGSLIFGIPGSIIGAIISFIPVLWNPSLFTGYFIIIPVLCLVGFKLRSKAAASS